MAPEEPRQTDPPQTDPPVETPPASPTIQQAAKEDPEGFRKFVKDLLDGQEARITEGLKKLGEDLGLTRKDVTDFWNWAKTDPNEGGSAVIDNPSSTTPPATPPAGETTPPPAGETTPPAGETTPPSSPRKARWW